MNEGASGSCCDLCGCDLELGGPWIGLNRYVLGKGPAHTLSSVLIADQYVWEPGEEDGDEECWTGHLLCWPTCLLAWIEAQLIEVEFDRKRT